MKKLIAIAMALLLVFALIVPASAVTTLKWDWGAARKSIGNAAGQIVQEQQTEPTEIPEAEYDVVEETEAEPHTTTEPVTEPIPEREQSWRDWLRRWSWCPEGWK